ncbi:MAG TPA: glycosyltransferase [Phycisphaerae bacterium]|nr:glycosyltransferase [Phycisphaerae bacterium]
MTIAYITSRYPYVSHTFILREIQALRALGLDICTFSVRRPDDREVLTELEKNERAQTSYILPAGPLKLLAAHTRWLVQHPFRYLSALMLALHIRPPGVRGLLWGVFYFAEAALLAGELRSRRVDHLHAHFANVAASLAMIAAKLTGTSWSMTLHGQADFGCPSETRLAQKIHSARFVCCVCGYGREQAIHAAGQQDADKIHLVSCGLDLGAFPATTCDNRQGRPTDQRPIELLTVGRLSPEKGHEFLLEALATLRRRNLPVTCTFIGDGPQHQFLRHRAAQLGVTSHVHFVGSVGQDRIQDLYRRADIFVLPSLAEGLPVVLLEAMALQRPVVASRIAGIPELVQDGVNGLLVAPARSDQLADAIERLVRDPHLRQHVSAAARQAVLDRHDIRISADRMARLFAAVVSPLAAVSSSPASGEPVANAAKHAS